MVSSPSGWADKFNMRVLKRAMKEDPKLLLNPANLVKAGLCVAVPASMSAVRRCRKLLPLPHNAKDKNVSSQTNSRTSSPSRASSSISNSPSQPNCLRCSQSPTSTAPCPNPFGSPPSQRTASCTPDNSCTILGLQTPSRTTSSRTTASRTSLSLLTIREEAIHPQPSTVRTSFPAVSKPVQTTWPEPSQSGSTMSVLPVLALAFTAFGLHLLGLLALCLLAVWLGFVLKCGFAAPVTASS